MAPHTASGPPAEKLSVCDPTEQTGDEHSGNISPVGDRGATDHKTHGSHRITSYIINIFLSHRLDRFFDQQKMFGLN